MFTRFEGVASLLLAITVAIAACDSPPPAKKVVPPQIQTNAVTVATGFAIQPLALDFGKVIATKTGTASVAITNSSGADVDITISPVQGADALLFSTSPAAGSTLTLANQETKSVTVTYAPQVVAAAASQGSFSVQLCTTGDGCAPTISLQGQSVAPDLTVGPSPMAFGFTLTGKSSAHTLTLTNQSAQAVHLTADPVVATLNADGSAASPGVFSLAAGAPLNGATIAAGQGLQIPLTFAPTDTVLYPGEVLLFTDDALNPTLVVPISGIGGGPAISCTPSSLDFGRNAVGIGTTQSIVCTNLGQDVPGHPEASLFIPDPTAAGSGLSILNGDPAFQPTFDQPFPATGLAAGQSTTIDVAYNAAIQGQDSDSLVIASNDPVSPQSSVALSGSALLLPACSFKILPATGLAFGHLASGTSAVLPFVIANTGTGDCLVNDLQLAAGSSETFSLPDYPALTRTGTIIPGGGRLAVNVQFAPTTASAAFTATVDFTVSDPTQPNQSIVLTGSSVQGCLLIQPSAIDFGQVGYSPTTSTYCSSATLTVTLRNVCDATDVTVNSLTVLDLANQPEFVIAGDPTPFMVPHLCPNYSFCAPTTPLTFTVSFNPTVVGEDLGGVQVATSDLTDPYLIPLKGSATQNQGVTESFTGHAAAVDVLWVLDTDDDPNAQTAIIGNLTNFLTYPVENGIDFHMATTSTDVYANASSEDGRMEPCPGCKVDGQAMTVVTSAGGMPAAVASLTTLLNLGSGYGCYTPSMCNGFASDELFFESVYEALSPALLSGYNQAFYRPDASLAVIIVNDDAEDDRSDSHGSMFYYNAFLGLKGVNHPEKFSFSYVNDYGGLNNNQKAAQMVQMTGGVEADFSNTGTPNWTDELGALWPQLGAQLLNYPLSGTPVANTIQVVNNGVVLPETAQGGATNWTYDARANALRFDPSAFPQPGDAVQISYTLACN